MVILKLILDDWANYEIPITINRQNKKIRTNKIEKSNAIKNLRLYS